MRERKGERKKPRGVKEEWQRKILNKEIQERGEKGIRKGARKKGPKGVKKEEKKINERKRGKGTEK